MRAEAAYDELLRRAREQSLLGSCAELLTWDEETYMPARGTRHRGDQLALLAGLQHAQMTDPRLGELLDVLEHSDLVRDPQSPAAVNVRELRRLYKRLTHLPRKLVEELTRVTTMAQREWARARKDAYFARFRPWLEKIVHLKRREAEALDDGAVPYDALLDEYEPGAKSDALAELFDSLRQDLMPLVNALVYGRRRPNRTILEREFNLEGQQAFAERVAAAVGFDFVRGRLDPATHPSFSAIGPGDYRITTRYHSNRFSDAFFSTLHEVGHILYEQGLDPAHHGTPMGEAVSLGMHEGQARLWENTIGRSLPFWSHFFPSAQAIFPSVLRDVDLEEFHFAINNVEPSYLRVGADEVTYNLHILARFDLERDLIGGELRAADLPAAWNEVYRRYLGIVPPDDAQGCLQDGHWASGLFGYFPTYTLGNLFAAQLFASARDQLGDLDSAFAQGDFTGICGWLREKVYRHGQRTSASNLIKEATGSCPDSRALLDGLRGKYLRLYGV
jgi:carboxypeptidase Taq